MNENTDAMHREVTRSEEHLVMHSEWRPRARYRFGKRIVAEERVERIDVHHEEFYFDEVPISAFERLEISTGLVAPRDNPGEAAGDVELILYREEIVVTRRVVPYERVRVHRSVAQGLTTVHDDVRREHVEVERGA